MTRFTPRPRQRLALLLLTNLLMLGLLALLAELTLRGAFDPRYAPRPDFEILHPSTVWANTPGLNHTYYGKDFSQHIATDGFGNRLDGLGPPGPEDSLLLLVGDSYTFGWGVSGDQTFAAYLDQRLARTRPGWRIVNLGVPGFSTLAMAQRLEDYLETIDRRRVKGILVLHADNDPVDNVLYLQYKTGFLVRSYPPRSPMSRSRLLNLLTRTWRTFSAPQVAGPKTHGQMVWEGVDWGAFEQLAPLETDLAATKKLRHLTPLQGKLLGRAVAQIQRACAGQNLPIHHLILYLGPESEVYAPAMQEAISGQPAYGNRLYQHGLMKLGSWDRAVWGHNRHSGGHFTPAYNRHCAKIMFELLQLER